MTPLEHMHSALQIEPLVCHRLASLWARQPRTTPDAWAKANRVYPLSAGRPGPRDPDLTPYIIAFERFFADDRYETCALITGTQMSKTDGILDVMGWRLDSNPRPQLYVGPSKDFVENQFEPRLMAMFDQAPRLGSLLLRGKRNRKTRKTCNGVSICLAWAGSATSLSSDQAGDVYVDEYDKMVRGPMGDGDPFTLAKARADTYRDRKVAVTSTPRKGRVGTETCPRSRLQFWAAAEPADLESPIWSKWQTGTRHHFAWQCPHCRSWFIPRLRDLTYPDGAPPAQARRSTVLACPVNGCVIEEDAKAAMNAAGTFVAPGQIIHPDGSVEGHPPDATMLSLWVSGLASPFVSWGERVEEVLLARLSGDEDAEMGAVTKVGELFSPAAGEALDWHVVAQQRRPYRRGEIPEGVAFLTAGVDVQKDRLIYVVRGWGEHQEAWLIDHDEIYGETHEPAVWLQLAGLLERGVAGLPILRNFIDSGFRPGKRDAVPEHAVYEFCRRYGRLVYATKGYDRRDKPLSVNRIDVDAKGARPRYGLDLVRLSTDFFKSWVHRRVNWPAGQPGGWHLPEDVSDGYCRQIVSETRVVSRDGQARWEQRSRENHALDCEALAYAAAYMLGIHRLSSATLRLAAAKAAEGPTQRPAPPSATPIRPLRARENSWLGERTRDWLRR